MSTIPPKKLEPQALALGRSRTSLPAVATVPAAGDIDDTTSSRSNIMSDKRMIAAKQKFYQQLDVNLSKKKIKRTKIPTEQEHNEICCVLESWKVGEKHSPLHANWYRNYTLLGNTSRSAALRWKKSKQDQNLKVATKEQMFVIIMEGHSALGHAKDPRKIYEEIGKMASHEKMLNWHFHCVPLALQLKRR